MGELCAEGFGGGPAEGLGTGGRATYRGDWGGRGIPQGLRTHTASVGTGLDGTDLVWTAVCSHVSLFDCLVDWLIVCLFVCLFVC